jgi:hypothetical protein
MGLDAIADRTEALVDVVVDDADVLHERYTLVGPTKRYP